ncbi:MAG: aminoacyl-tRNA hydrolase [Deltaproteobacteria bacterium]|nr:aminoacyl-tRNA hydrolase [Deltaproteobacteria bacterium]
MPDRSVLIVGLGNPGPDYELTRHNAGFLAIDYFAGEVGQPITSEKWQGLFSRTRLSGKTVFLLKPQAFMNRSGECVARFATYFKIEPQHILVIHDDLDLEPGRIKIVARGGAGGHNGIRSVIRHLGASDFARIKIGIGRPPVSGHGSAMPVERFVLAAFTPAERDLFRRQLDLVAEGIRLFISQGIEVAMNSINGRSGQSAAGQGLG